MAFGLLTATLSAQSISENTGESSEIKKRQNKNETPVEIIDKPQDDKIVKDLEQAEPKKPRFGGHVGVVIPIVTRGDGNTVTLAEDFIIGFPFGLTVSILVAQDSLLGPEIGEWLADTRAVF